MKGFCSDVDGASSWKCTKCFGGKSSMCYNYNVSLSLRFCQNKNILKNTLKKYIDEGTTDGGVD